MNNESETIEGVEGEWRTVTKASEVTVGQRVRYTSVNGVYWGYGDEPRFVFIHNGKVATRAEIGNGNCRDNLFNGTCKNIRAFFPLAKPQKRKVAKVTIEQGYSGYWFNASLLNGNFSSSVYTSDKSARRDAKRFCKAIGYEMEVVE